MYVLENSFENNFNNWTSYKWTPSVQWPETISYQLWKNVLTRLEFRLDHDTTGSDFYGNGEDNAILIAANILYKF